MQILSWNSLECVICWQWRLKRLLNEYIVVHLTADVFVCWSVDTFTPTCSFVSELLCLLNLVFTFETIAKTDMYAFGRQVGVGSIPRVFLCKSCFSLCIPVPLACPQSIHYTACAQSRLLCVVLSRSPRCRHPHWAAIQGGVVQLIPTHDEISQGS